jgi:hypothetical protein
MAATAIKGILKRILEPLLVGFSTKDLSLSFLGGKAKLRDIEVNVDAINEKLNQMQGVSCYSIQCVDSRARLTPFTYPYVPAYQP